MSEEQPLWRQGFDVVERAVATRLEEVIGSERFAIAVGLASQAQKAVQRRTEKTTRRLLHVANLPAGSDITRILNELAQLQRQVRELAKQSGSGGTGSGGTEPGGASSVAAAKAQARPAPVGSAKAPPAGAQVQVEQAPPEKAQKARPPKAAVTAPPAQTPTTEKPKEVARGSRDDGQTRPGRPGAARR